ncbi:chemotaxis protein CheE [Brevundimonas sp.]|uniref:chemotaxis protein CheE n=1 Tax=Brevundimonas sp. TaxID=1871086 RepID=UPI002FC97C51
MTTVITHNRRRSRLSSLIDQPGGISTGIALKQAAQNLASMEEQSLQLVEQTIQQLAALPAPDGIENLEGALNKAYALSAGIIDAAGPFAREDLCMAATNLCDLLDGSPSDQPFDWRIITVHAQSFRLLLALPKEDTTTRQQVLDSLKDVLKVKLGG